MKKTGKKLPEKILARYPFRSHGNRKYVAREPKRANFSFKLKCLGIVLCLLQ